MSGLDIDNPSIVATEKLCIRRMSKDLVDGTMKRLSESRACTDTACLTMTRKFSLHYPAPRGVWNSSPCDEGAAVVAALGTQASPGSFSADFVTVSQGTGDKSARDKARGFHVGTFTWSGPTGLSVTGSLSGMTNVGTVRGGGNPFGNLPAPCDKKCSETCDASGWMQGRLEASFQFKQRAYKMTAVYRILYDPAVNENVSGECNSHGVVEGVVVEACSKP